MGDGESLFVNMTTLAGEVKLALLAVGEEIALYWLGVQSATSWKSSAT
ncbi:hypothetical protein OKW30_003536 [Paraburkholderia sp. Clong3]